MYILIDFGAQALLSLNVFNLQTQTTVSHLILCNCVN